MKEMDSKIMTSFNSGLQKLTGYKRRLYAAELCNAFFNGSARQAERALKVSRRTVSLGQKELLTGMECVSNFHLRGAKKKS